MVGSRDYFDPEYDGNVNVATRPRQPGSSFKPIVYAAAFERGFTPDTIIFDLPTDFGGGYHPQNYTGQTYGPVTARQALSNSLNIASVKMLWLAGIGESVALAQRLGISTLTEGPDHYGLSLVLGGGAITLLEETSAFGTFATAGLRTPTEALLSVEDAGGEALFVYEPEANQVLEQEVARQINDILSDNAARALVFGTQNSLTLGSRPVAAKTGTAQDFRDAWTVGYTPSLATGVWVGNNDYSPMARGADGSVVAAPIWNRFMRSALSGTPVEEFRKPKPIVTGKPILDGRWAGEQTLRIDRASGKRATDRTPPEWVEERTYRTIHDTLFWINKRAPRGAPPENPSADPQFMRWESAVQQWIAGDPELVALASTQPPEDFDDIHLSLNEPRVRILAPQPGDRATDSLTVIVSVEAPFDIDTVAVTLGETAFGSLQRNAVSGYYEKTIPLPEEIRSGDGEVERDIVVRAFDIYGNRGEASVSLLFTNDE